MFKKTLKMSHQYECKVEMKSSVADMSYQQLKIIFANKRAFNFSLLKMKVFYNILYSTRNFFNCKLILL